MIRDSDKRSVRTKDLPDHSLVMDPELRELYNITVDRIGKARGGGGGEGAFKERLFGIKPSLLKVKGCRAAAL